jgi:hypothetical protein
MGARCHHQPAGIFIWKRAEEDGIHEAKNGGVGANAKRERNN